MMDLMVVVPMALQPETAGDVRTRGNPDDAAGKRTDRTADDHAGNRAAGAVDQALLCVGGKWRQSDRAHAQNECPTNLCHASPV